MDFPLLRILILGLVLGLEHSLDPDHLIAVSTLQEPRGSRLSGPVVGALWGLGHAVTILVVGLVVILLDLNIPVGAIPPLESLVGIVLIALGARVVWQLRRRKVHVHEHGHGRAGRDHIHFHSHATSGEHEHDHLADHLGSLLVGMVHGLAGSAALTILVVGTMSVQVQRLTYLVAFGLGSVLGMAAVSASLSILLGAASRRSLRFYGVLRAGIGTFSILLGILWIGRAYVV